MKDRYEVSIRIESRIDSEVFDQTVDGLVYRKRDSWYLRYEENDEAGGATRTLVKLAPDEWTVKRSGTIESEMAFERERRRRGYYRTSGIELQVVTLLLSASVELEEGQGTVSWDYELEIGDAPLQQHRITYTLTGRN